MDGSNIGTAESPCIQLLIDVLHAQLHPWLVEVGTLRWEQDRPTHHEAWAPHGVWTKVDATDGVDVDLADDAHTMAATLSWMEEWGERPPGFDAYVACSVWEHLERPWRAMHAAGRVIRPGGLVYVQTHQTFPLHGYPRDFYRFSTEALEIQAQDAGLEVVRSGYLYPCVIEPPPEVTRWNRLAESWMNVEILARRPE